MTVQKRSELLMQAAFFAVFQEEQENLSPIFADECELYEAFEDTMQQIQEAWGMYPADVAYELDHVVEILEMLEAPTATTNVAEIEAALQVLAWYDVFADESDAMREETKAIEARLYDGEELSEADRHRYGVIRTIQLQFDHELGQWMDRVELIFDICDMTVLLEVLKDYDL